MGVNRRAVRGGAVLGAVMAIGIPVGVAIAQDGGDPPEDAQAAGTSASFAPRSAGPGETVKLTVDCGNGTATDDEPTPSGGSNVLTKQNDTGGGGKTRTITYTVNQDAKARPYTYKATCNIKIVNKVKKLPAFSTLTVTKTSPTTTTDTETTTTDTETTTTDTETTDTTTTNPTSTTGTTTSTTGHTKTGAPPKPTTSGTSKPTKDGAVPAPKPGGGAGGHGGAWGHGGQGSHGGSGAGGAQVPHRPSGGVASGGGGMASAITP